MGKEKEEKKMFLVNIYESWLINLETLRRKKIVERISIERSNRWRKKNQIIKSNNINENINRLTSWDLRLENKIHRIYSLDNSKSTTILNLNVFMSPWILKFLYNYTVALLSSGYFSFSSSFSLI